MAPRTTITVKKAWLGWWVNGNWCPNRAVRDHAIGRAAGGAHTLAATGARIRADHPALGHLADEDLLRGALSMSHAINVASMSRAEAVEAMRKVQRELLRRRPS